nr:reverse transcriptase domain-containing protein [Tanacetum cinerariifolium]
MAPIRQSSTINNGESPNNDGTNPNITAIIAQQIQNIIPHIVTQVTNNINNANANGGNGNVRNRNGGNGGNNEGCTYKEFLACKSRDFNGKGGAIVLTRWIEKMKSVMDINGRVNNQKSKPNGKLIYKSIMNGPYVRRMISEPGDPDCEVPVAETFNEQTNDELTKKEVKQMEADDQAIQIILMGLPEDIYAAIDSCETAQEIWLRVQQMMKGSDIGIQDKKAKFFNEWERFTSIDGELIESYYHRFSKLMNDFKRNKHFSEKIASNLKFLNNLQPEWRRHDTIVHQIKDLLEVDYNQLYGFLKYNQAKVNELGVERLTRAHDPLALMTNSNNPYNYLVFHQDQPSSITYMQQPQP